MKSWKVLVLLICFGPMVNAQNDTLPVAATQQAQLEKIRNRRIKDISFAYQTQSYAPRSYACPPFLDLGSPKSWYILSADIIPQFIIGSERIPLTMHLITRYMVRILHDNKEAGDSSFAVRTPSFMPGGIVFIPLHYENAQSANISYMGIGLFHHSNGQDGHEFNSDGSFNLYNGNFSTNYIEPSFHFRRRKYALQPAVIMEPAARHNYNELYGSAGLELHFGTSDSLKSSYGDRRIKLQLGYIRVMNYWSKYKGQKLSSYFEEKDRMIFDLMFIAGDRDRGLSAFEKRINTSIQYYWRIKGSPNSSLFTSIGYYGSDPYNIYYANSYFFFRAGIALGIFVTPNFK